ncbi:MAG: ribonuclease R family protein [Phycisphaerales bacterium]
MFDPYSSRLMAHLQHDTYQPVGIDHLRTDLGVPDTHKAEFLAAVDGLTSKHKITVDDKGLVRLPSVGKDLIGMLRKNQRGFGFVIPETAVREGDVFIPPDGMGDALSGDTVRVEVGRKRKPHGGGEELFGRVVQVIKRKRKVFTGELSQRGPQWLVMPDGRELTDPVVIRDPQAKNAKKGDKVVIEITAYPEGNTLAEGVIVDVLGEAGTPSVETHAVIAAYNLPGEFPEQAVAQAGRAAEQFNREVEAFEYDAAGAGAMREDLRGEFIITIDPPDAKDYDDALHIKRLPGGEGWQLGVHIADVAHFIPTGTPLDVEARKRGNSVYLPRLVIPMLPEVLSNGICSLQEGVDRFCKSAFMRYDRQGNLRSSGVGNVLIKSAKRLTYLEAQALIDGDETEAKKHAKTEPNYTPKLFETLREMDACAKAIRTRRRAAGMIHLDLPQAVLIYDDDGRVIDAEPEDQAFTHTLIEMFMVEANEVLARLFESVRVPLLRRIHPEPTPGDVGELRTAAKVAGFSIPKSPTRAELQTLLDGTRGTAAAPAVHMAVLRSLTKAEYSPALVGHFALASSAYAHFTSPIRRYPDLTVHRALSEYLRHTANGKKAPPADDEKARFRLGEKLMESEKNCPSEDELALVGKQCSRTEENASSAENDLRSFLILQLLANHVGESFKGMVTGATNAGVFIKLAKYLAEGLIKREDLPNFPDQNGRVRGGLWRLDPRTSRMTHEASGRSFGIGDQVEVTIANVDLAVRRMDLVVTDATSREKSKVRKYPKRGDDRTSSPTGPVGGLGVGGPLIPRTREEWDAFKHGKSGSTGRSQKSKSRDKGKTHHRRDG